MFVTATLSLILQDLSEKDLLDLEDYDEDRIHHFKRALAESAKQTKDQIGHDSRSGYGMLDAVAWRDAIEASADNW